MSARGARLRFIIHLFFVVLCCSSLFEVESRSSNKKLWHQVRPHRIHFPKLGLDIASVPLMTLTTVVLPYGVLQPSSYSTLPFLYYATSAVAHGHSGTSWNKLSFFR